MSVFFKALAVMLLVLPAASLNAAGQAKSTVSERSTTSVKHESTLSEGGLTIPGLPGIYKPLPSEEDEKLGREGVKRKIKEQKR